MHSKFEKIKKNFRKNFFYQNDIENFFFGEKNQKSSLIHQNDGLDELITIMDGFQPTTTFWGTFGRFYGPGLGGPNRPYTI